MIARSTAFTDNNRVLGLVVEIGDEVRVLMGKRATAMKWKRERVEDRGPRWKEKRMSLKLPSQTR